MHLIFKKLRAPVLVSALVFLSLPPALAAGKTVDAAAALLDGRVIVTERDIKDSSNAESCRGADALTSRKAAFMRLLEAGLAEEAMRAHGGPRTTAADLKADAERIDRETRAPEILACIKKYFAGDTQRYLRIFVRTAYVESRFRLFMMRDPGVQEEQSKKARAALERARGGASFETAAKEFSLAYTSATYALSASSDSPRAPMPGRPWSPYEADFIREQLMPLAAGQMKGEPLETDFDFRLVRLLGKDADGRRWTFEAVSAPKQTQEGWLKSLPKGKLTVADDELRAWLLSIKGNPRLSAVEILAPAPTGPR